MMAFKKMILMDSVVEERSKTMHAAVAEDLGRAIRIFNISAASDSSNAEEEPDDFYDLTPEDYYRIMSSQERSHCRVLKSRKIREADVAACRRNMSTRATMRVRFPDGYVLEAEFQPSEKIQSLLDLLGKAVARPELPFYLYTTPPKERIKDLSKDFYSAGFAPGALVYFSYDLSKVADNADVNQCPYLRREILALDGLHRADQADSINSAPEPARVDIAPAVPETKTVIRKSTKPKWFKL